jgi:hypothetical protein
MMGPWSIWAEGQEMIKRVRFIELTTWLWAGVMIALMLVILLGEIRL